MTFFRERNDMKKFKKTCMIVACLVCVTAMSACGSNDGSQNGASEPGTVDMTAFQTDNKADDKEFTEQDIAAMFDKSMRSDDTEYIDCAVMPDKAYGRVGAALFRNTKENTVNIAFFDADGYAQQCGTYAELADAPEFRYLGDGKVTCRMQTESGDIYNMTLTFSADGSDIRFLMEDDLPK